MQLYLELEYGCDMNGEQVDKFLRIVRDHRKIIGYTIDDLKGISPSFLHA